MPTIIEANSTAMDNPLHPGRSNGGRVSNLRVARGDGTREGFGRHTAGFVRAHDLWQARSRADKIRVHSFRGT